jgi:hypothetical protein
VGDLDKEAEAGDCASRPSLEEAGMEAGELTRLLDDIPGAWESAELGRIQAATGQTVPLREL